MKIYKLFIALLLSAFLFSSCNKQTEVKGDVFIVTQGAGNYKLGLVQVAMIPEEKVKSYVDANVSVADAASKAYQASVSKATSAYSVAVDKMEKQNGYSMNADSSLAVARNSKDEMLRLQDEMENAMGEKFYAGLPRYIASATSDADGKFTLTIPKKGKYLLAAKATRKVGEEDEKYYWFLWFDAKGDPANIILSNNNTSQSTDANSVFRELATNN